MIEVRVTGLWVYPIKSCRGISLQEMQIGPTGPISDRQWMIVDENNQFISLRTHPKLSQIHTSIDHESLKVQFGKNQIELNLSLSSTQIQPIVVQDKSFLAGVESEQVNEQFSIFLEQPVKLVRYQSESFRDLGPAASAVSKETMFVDDRPVLITNHQSLEALNQKLSFANLESSSMNRFRSNIILSGMDAYQEEKIKRITIGDVILSNPKLCSRCVIVTMDENSGQAVSKETLKYLPLHKFEKGPRIIFGKYFTPEKLGTLKLNDLCQIEFED